MIVDEPVNNVHNFLALLIGKAQAIAGQIIESEIYDITLNELEKDIRTKYNTLTLAEVEFALLRGAKGEYGDYYGLNVKTFTKWLNDYRFSPERLEAIRQKTKTEATRQIPATTTVTTEQSTQMAVEKAVDDFNAFKAMKTAIDMGCTTYNFLSRLGLLSLSPDDKWRLFREAGQQIREEKKQKRQPRVIFEAAGMTDRDKLIEKNDICDRAKKLALKEYFRKIAANNTDFEYLLKKAINHLKP